VVKGGNYRKNEVVGGEFAGKVTIIPQLKGYSGDEIAKKISNLK
jgi:bifunctional ADP-heptose synthase (sugar kinase/adenylyltransferase)